MALNTQESFELQYLQKIIVLKAEVKRLSISKGMMQSYIAELEDKQKQELKEKMLNDKHLKKLKRQNSLARRKYYVFRDSVLAGKPKGETVLEKAHKKLQRQFESQRKQLAEAAGRISMLESKLKQYEQNT